MEKTKTASRNTDRLPIVLMGSLVTASGLDWLSAWLNFRESIGIGIPGFPVFPARQDSVWQRNTSSVGAGNAVLRDLLEISGIASAQKFSSHSFKATTLSYACSFGMDLPSRKVLGYHSVSSDK